MDSKASSTTYLLGDLGKFPELSVYKFCLVKLCTPLLSNFSHLQANQQGHFFMIPPNHGFFKGDCPLSITHCLLTEDI